MDSRLARAITSLLLTTSTASVASSLAARLDLASDAAFRGWRQNNGPTAALRGDYGSDGGAYLGAAIANDRSVGDARLDLHAGASGNFSFQGYLPYRLDGGIAGALFTGGHSGGFGRNPDYAEAYGGLKFGPLSLNIAAAPDYFATGAAGFRLGGAARMPIGSSFWLGGQLAWNGGEGVRRYVAVRTAGRRETTYGDYGLTVGADLPHGFSIYGQAFGTSVAGDRAPRALIGLRLDLSR